MSVITTIYCDGKADCDAEIEVPILVTEEQAVEDAGWTEPFACLHLCPSCEVVGETE